MTQKLPFTSPENLPDLGIKPRFPTLQADVLLTELQADVLLMFTQEVHYWAYRRENHNRKRHMYPSVHSSTV